MPVDACMEELRVMSINECTRVPTTYKLKLYSALTHALDPIFNYYYNRN